MTFSPARFDAEALARYHISLQDIERARRYVILLQGPDSETLADIAAGCPYATSALLHEVTEVRVLLRRDPHLLSRSRRDALAFLQSNEDAHLQALMVEYPYLQQQIAANLGEVIGLGDLVMANAARDDFLRLFDSDLSLPVFPPTRAGTRRARELIDQLKQCACEELKT